jgi:hypothetical protein
MDGMHVSLLCSRPFSSHDVPGHVGRQLQINAQSLNKKKDSNGLPRDPMSEMMRTKFRLRKTLTIREQTMMR